MDIYFFFNALIVLPIIVYVAVVLLEVLAQKAQQTAIDKKKYVVLSVRVAKENESGPVGMEQVLATIHSIVSNLNLSDRLKGKIQEKISFEIANIGRSIRFYVHVPSKLKHLVEGQIYAQYPFVEIEEVADYAKETTTEVGAINKTKSEGRDIVATGTITSKITGKEEFVTIGNYANAVAVELGLSSLAFKPIKTHDALGKTDALAGITATLAKFSDATEQAWLQVVISPVPESRRSYFSLMAKSLPKNKLLKKWYWQFFYPENSLWRKIFFPITWLLSPKEEKKADPKAKTELEPEMAKKLAALQFVTSIRIVYVPKEKNEEVALVKLKEIAGSFKQFNNESNGFKITRIITDNALAIERFQKRVLEDGFLLSVPELATVYHLPTNLVQTPNIYWVRSKRIEPPNDLPVPNKDQENPVTSLGKTNFRGMVQEFGMKPLDRRRHMYIIGKTGMGKSVLLENMLFSDIQAGRGVAVVDPHGDLAEAVINFVPSWRTNDVVVFDPSDRDFPIAFNMLENIDPALSTIIASGLVGIFKKIYADSWGPRLEHILRNTILTLLEYPGTTMLGIPRILQDADYRKKVVRKVTDPIVRSFWLNEFEKMEPKQRVEAISPILNKVGQFLSSPINRNILGQVKSKVDFRYAMDHKKIVVVNLSKGKIGEDNSSLLGSMIITKFQIDAMSRANIPEKDRVDFFLYVDEFQNFATDSFATILSEARKYRLSLNMANQYIAQMPDEVRDAVFGNVGSIMSFQVGVNDAEFLSQQFSGEVTPNDLVNLSKYTCYMRLLIDGMPSKTFSLNTLPPPVFDQEEGRVEKVLRIAREKYCTPRTVVEDKIMRWSKGADIDEGVLSGPEEEAVLSAPQAPPVLPAVTANTAPIKKENSPVLGKKVSETVTLHSPNTIKGPAANNKAS